MSLGRLGRRSLGSVRDADIVVLTGDDEEATDFFKQHEDVTHVFATVPPEGKTATIRRLKSDGQVAMVGDGTNDAPALAAADLGISLGGGTALAADAADLAIVDNDIRSVETAFDPGCGSSSRETEQPPRVLLRNGIALGIGRRVLQSAVSSHRSHCRRRSRRCERSAEVAPGSTSRDPNPRTGLSRSGEVLKKRSLLKLCSSLVRQQPRGWLETSAEIVRAVAEQASLIASQNGDLSLTDWNASRPKQLGGTTLRQVAGDVQRTRRLAPPIPSSQSVSNSKRSIAVSTRSRTASASIVFTLPSCISTSPSTITTPRQRASRY